MDVGGSPVQHSRIADCSVSDVRDYRQMAPLSDVGACVDQHATGACVVGQSTESVLTACDLVCRNKSALYVVDCESSLEGDVPPMSQGCEHADAHLKHKNKTLVGCGKLDEIGLLKNLKVSCLDDIIYENKIVCDMEIHSGVCDNRCCGVKLGAEVKTFVDVGNVDNSVCKSESGVGIEIVPRLTNAYAELKSAMNAGPVKNVNNMSNFVCENNGVFDDGWAGVELGHEGVPLVNDNNVSKFVYRNVCVVDSECLHNEVETGFDFRSGIVADPCEKANKMSNPFNKNELVFSSELVPNIIGNVHVIDTYVDLNSSAVAGQLGSDSNMSNSNCKYEVVCGDEMVPNMGDDISIGVKLGASIGSPGYVEDAYDNTPNENCAGCCDDGGLIAQNIFVVFEKTDWCRLERVTSQLQVDREPICILCVCDVFNETRLEKRIDIFVECLSGVCDCTFEIAGAVVQLKPCRMFSEACCCGVMDEDWEFLLKGVCFGFRVIDTECKSRYFKSNYSSITAGAVGETMSDRLLQELESGYLDEVQEPCACVHAMGAVPKSHDDFRAIVDCSSPEGTCVNECTKECKETFSYNSVNTVIGYLQRGDFTCTVDISNAYRAVSIHPLSRERQGLSWDFGSGPVYLRDNRLCMGLSSSPYVFTKLSNFVVRCLCRAGWRECVNYLDDFCIIARSYTNCAMVQRALVSILRRLGFFISFRKLSAPSRVTRFLGIDIDSDQMELRLPEDKMVKLKLVLRSFVHKRKATRRELEQLGGILAHCCKVVRGGRTFSRRVYSLIASVKKATHRVRLNQEFKADVLWWIEFSSMFNGKAKIIAPQESTLSVYSDASLHGFGALHGSDWLAGVFGEDGAGLTKWLGHHFEESDDPGCRSGNINVLEMWPILQGVRRWSAGWRDRSVTFVTDNTQVMCAINTGRSTNKTVMAWLRKFFWLAINNNFELDSVYLSSEANIICDSLSRLDKYKNVARIRDADPMGYMCCFNIFRC